MGLFSSNPQDKAFTALMRACETGDVEKLRAAIAAGADVNRHAKNKGTPLGVAVESNFHEGIRILIENKANPNGNPGDGNGTYLISAINGGRNDAAKILIENGADVNGTRKDGQTALHIAAYYGRGDSVKMLFDMGADPNLTDNRMNTAYDTASSRYPRIADLIRSKQKPEPAPKPERPPIAGWRLTARDEVSNVTEKPEIGYRLTEIFNFGAGIYTRIARNMQTGAESQSLKFFDEFADRAAIERAQEALVRLGGEPPANKLAKPSLAPRPQGGTP